MKWLVLVIALALLVGFVPATARADDGKDGNRGLILRTDGNVTVAAGESVGSVVVISGDARVDGTVRDLLFVVKGNATITGNVDKNIVVIEGDLTLASTAKVKDVHLVRGSLIRDPAAIVTGHVSERDNFAFVGWAAALFSIAVWFGMTVFVLAGGLLFAAIGGRQLTASAKALTADAGKTVLAALAVWIGLPLLAVLLLISVIGIPVGIGLILFVLPTIGFLGYIVSGARLGGGLIGLVGRPSGEHPYSATFIGLLALQLVLLIPVVGALVCVLAGLWGAGALALFAWRAARGTPAAPAPPAETTASTPVS